MHTLAFILGALTNIIGDVALWIVITLIAGGPRGYFYDEYFEYPSRSAAAFALLPIPLGVSLAGAMMVWWGGA